MFRFKRFVSMITAASLTASLILNTAFITPVSADEECMSASDCVNAIGAGWNLGNTLDANGTWITADAGNYMAYETAWGNPVTTQAMIDSVRDKGFNAIRIPVTWSQHIDGNGHVNEAWMDRVKTIVDYCYNDGLYVILFAFAFLFRLGFGFRILGEQLQVPDDVLDLLFFHSLFPFFA